MSRYEQLSTDGKHRVVYGYDNPLDTFFLQVFELKEENPGNSAAIGADDARSDIEPVADDDASWDREVGLIAWLGTLTGQVPIVDDLISAAAPYVSIPETTLEKLKADQQNAPGPTPFQRAIRI